jgi:ankyrin repeat protein
MAVQFRSFNAIRSLLKYGANLHALYEGMTPIDMAIEDEDEEIIQIMVDFNPKLMETEYASNVVDEDPDFLTMTANLHELTGGKSSELSKLAQRYAYMEDTVQTETGCDLMERSPSKDSNDDNDDDENSILHLQRELEEIEAMEALLLTREEDKQDEEDKEDEEDDEEAKVSVMRAPTAQNFVTKKKTNKRRLKRATAIRR